LRDFLQECNPGEKKKTFLYNEVLLPSGPLRPCYMTDIDVTVKLVVILYPIL